MTFEQFLSKIDAFYNENEFEMRYGQTIMNVLHKAWPEKYKEISGGSLDCFYDDGIVNSTLDHLKRNWLDH